MEVEIKDLIAASILLGYFLMLFTRIDNQFLETIVLGILAYYFGIKRTESKNIMVSSSRKYIPVQGKT